MTDPNVATPLEAVISAVVALDDTLDQELYPQARHQARVVALRAEGAGLPDIAARAHELLAVLESAIKPASVARLEARNALHQAVDTALM